MKDAIEVRFEDGEVISLPIEQHLDITDNIGLELSKQAAYQWRYAKVMNRAKEVKRDVDKRYARWRSNAVKWARRYLSSEGDHRPTDKAVSAVIRRLYDTSVVDNAGAKNEFAQLIAMDDVKSIQDIVHKMYPDKISVEEWEDYVSGWERMVADLEQALSAIKTRGFSLAKLCDLQLQNMLDLQVAKAKGASERLSNRFRQTR